MNEVISKEISNKLKRRKFNNRGLWHEFDESQMSYEDALDLSIASLKAYGKDFQHWIIAYSGGKDSSALLAFVIWAIQNGHVESPQTLKVLYADTRMELPPLHLTATKVLLRVSELGYDTQKVEPLFERRFWVEILGKGLPPPKQSLRWCTERLKKDPMNVVFDEIQSTYGEQTNEF